MCRYLTLCSLLFFAFPFGANAESIWLILKISGRKSSAFLEKVEMASLEQCEEQGLYWRSRDPNRFENLDFVCLKGK
tara:strand:- start:592 stop:822 length:231 start_codon:yes stop_codon:yes gene_type:complete